MPALLSRLRTSASTFRGAFRNRDIARVVLGFAGACLGTWISGIAISVYAFEEGGAGALGIYVAVRLIPGAFLSPFAGTLADRYRRTRLMVASDAAALAATLATAALMLAGAPLWTIFLAGTLRVLVGTPFAPARAALTPSLAKSPDELTAANVASSSVEGVAVFLGPAIGGALLVATSPQATLALSGLTLLWSMALVSRVRDETPAREAAPEEDDGSPGSPIGIVAETAAGVKAVATQPGLRVIVGLFVGQFLINGSLNVLVVTMSYDLLDLGDGGVGTLTSALGVGAVLGLILTLPLVGARRMAPSFGVGLLLWGIPLVLVPLLPDLVTVLVLLALVGLGSGLTDVPGITLLQRAADEKMLGRVFGILESLILLMLALGGLIVAPLISAFGLDATFVIVGALLPVVAILTYPALRRADAAAAGTVDAADVGLLSGVPMFAGLPAYTLEQLAGDLVRERFPAGTRLIEQGAEGDRFYVLVEGRAEATVDGNAVRVAGPGDWFGEIALLRKSPRTATITALTDVEVASLAGERFVSAVSGHAQGMRAAEAVVASRLATATPASLGGLR